MASMSGKKRVNPPPLPITSFCRACRASQTNACPKSSSECEYDHVRDPKFRSRARRYFANGVCNRGAACTFSHEATKIDALKARRLLWIRNPERAKQTRGPCRFFKQGTCKFGEGCLFAHKNDEDVEGDGEEGKAAEDGETKVAMSMCTGESAG